MPTFTATKSSGPEIADGLYPAKFKGVEDYQSALYGDGYRWLFDVTVEDTVETLDRLTSTSMGPKSTNRKIIAAIVGRQLEVGESVEINDYIGKPCRVMVKNPDEGGWPKITDILPPAKKA